jgi:hypothetical protein
MFAPTVRICRVGGHIQPRAGSTWLIAGDTLTTERADRTASRALQEDQAANQQTKEDGHVQHKPYETADRRTAVPQRAKIHVDLPTRGFPQP